MGSPTIRHWFVLAIVLTMPSLTLAQRNSDDADSNPSEARSGSEPPRLIRGGLMQQLRSVTESVLGSPEERDRDNRQTVDGTSQPPTPPAAPRNSLSTDPPSMSYGTGSQNNASGMSEPRDLNRNWAGQFLIPNHRLREQVGITKPRTSNNPAARKQPLIANRDSNESNPAPERRVYLGQTVPARPQAPQEKLQEADREELEQEPIPEVAVAALPQAKPQREPVEIQFKDSSTTPTEDSAEVLVSHVPDVPYVPRKPVPKRDKPSSSATTKDKTTSANKVLKGSLTVKAEDSSAGASSGTTLRPMTSGVEAPAQIAARPSLPNANISGSNRPASVPDTSSGHTKNTTAPMSLPTPPPNVTAQVAPTDVLETDQADTLSIARVPSKPVPHASLPSTSATNAVPSLPASTPVDATRTMTAQTMPAPAMPAPTAPAMPAPVAPSMPAPSMPAPAAPAMPTPSLPSQGLSAPKSMPSLEPMFNAPSPAMPSSSASALTNSPQNSSTAQQIAQPSNNNSNLNNPNLNNNRI